MLNTYRKHDAVIVVCQNNEKRQIEIGGLNKTAEEITGYTSEEMAGQAFSRLLPAKINSMVEDYVEYEDGSNDVGSVLGKVRGFNIKTCDGRERPYKLRVVRCEAVGSNPIFQIVLEDETETRREEAFRKILQENFKGHESIDERTGLPDRTSLKKDLELVEYHTGNKGLNACFAILRIDGYQELLHAHGGDISLALHRHVAAICRQKLRGDDTIGTTHESTLGIILMDVAPESARLVLNRLRLSLLNAPYTMDNGTPLPFTVSISFSRVESRGGGADVMTSCEKMLEELDDDDGNVIIDATIYERRAVKKDRRVKDQPFEGEEKRRLSDRRGND